MVLLPLLLLLLLLLLFIFYLFSLLLRTSERMERLLWLLCAIDLKSETIIAYEYFKVTHFHTSKRLSIRKSERFQCEMEFKFILIEFVRVIGSCVLAGCDCTDHFDWFIRLPGRSSDLLIFIGAVARIAAAAAASKIALATNL
jgi:hypothetical protein